MLTLPDSLYPTQRRAGDATVFSAFAASFFFHIAAFGVLALVTGGLLPGRIASLSDTGPNLEVVLTPPRVARDAAADTLAATTTPTGLFDVAPALTSAPALVPGTAASRAAGQASAADPTSAFRPHVTVSDSVPRARFGDFLEGDRLAGFPLEIDAPVRLPGKLEVPYPRAALAAREEGTVLVFAIIGEDGRVEESHPRFDRWSPELGRTVHEALTRMRFIPAVNDGKPIRFYVMLQFDFRIEAPEGASVAEGGAPPPAPSR